MHEAAAAGLDRPAVLEDAERTFQMTEDAFRAFYEQTARPLWAYLARMTGDPRLADDLMQETYYRFLRAATPFASDDHRRHYLFRVATNLIHDQRRRPRVTHVEVSAAQAASGGMDADRQARQIDLQRALERLRPRERSLLWLAYAEGFSHAEIAAVLGLRTSSLKALLFRARQRLLRFLTRPDDGARR